MQARFAWYRWSMDYVGSIFARKLGYHEIRKFS